MGQITPLFWLLDDEWTNHDLELSQLQAAVPDCKVHITSSMDTFQADLNHFGSYADLIITQISFPFNRHSLSSLKRCKGIAVLGSGYNNIDISAAREYKIPITNVNGYCAEDVADYVLAAIFRSYKRIDIFSRNIRSGLWGAQAIHSPIHRLSHQQLLLLGYGFIGKVVAQRAKALGMPVSVYDPYIPAEQIASAGVRPVSLEEGLKTADFVSIHMRLTPENRGIINWDFFSHMKSTSILINVARGGLIHEADLIQALNSGQIGGAVLDVTANEPIALDDPLLSAKNCTVTPHISYASEESIQELRLRAVNNALAMYRGETPRDLVL